MDFTTDVDVGSKIHAFILAGISGFPCVALENLPERDILFI